MREFTLLDKILSEIDLALRTVIPPENRISKRSFPGQGNSECNALDSLEKKHVAGLMRVNHAGEVCAQALYQGQGFTAHLTKIKKQMADAADEETDHLAWCEERLRDLNSQPSLLNPLWYLGSLMIGALAGLAGDSISLGFVAETEQQVGAHLQKHLENLPTQDKKTRAILLKMQEDESHHAQIANEAGAAQLPSFIKQAMRWSAKLMTKTCYYI